MNRTQQMLDALGRPMGDGFAGMPSPGAFPEPRVLQLRADDVEPRFTRVEVSVPTLLVPKRNDVLTGTDPLGSVFVSASPVNPASEEFGWGPTQADGTGGPALNFAAGQRGACFLWAPGVWWVRIDVSLGTASGLMEVWQFPIPDVATLTYFFFSRASPHPRSFQEPVGNAQMLVSVQEIMDGIQRVDIHPLDDDPPTFPPRIGLRFGEPPLITNNLRLQAGVIHQFEGNRLPLADIWVQSVGALVEVTWTVY